jgi:multiple sugar transport system permease protein
MTPSAGSSRCVQRGQKRERLRMALVGLLGLITLAPFLGALVLALTPLDQPLIPQRWPHKLTLANFNDVLYVGHFTQWLLNSILFAGVSVVIVLFVSAMAGYALARKRFPGRNAFFWSIVATLMVPMQATLIPLFVLVGKLHGIDTLWGLIVPTLANAQTVFLMRQFIRGLPDEVFDAAKIDGASEWRTFVAIILPLVRPVMATMGTFVFLWHWNDLLWPLIVGQSDKARTLTVGLSVLNGENGQYVPRLMAAAIVSALPCLAVFAFLQRYIVQGIAATGIKG